MKKMVCILLALLCFATVALADVVPSKTTADMNAVVEVTGGNEGLVIAVAPEAVPAAKQEVANTQVAKLAAAASVAEYFGNVASAEDKAVAVNLTEVLGAAPVVHEFMPIEVENAGAEAATVVLSLTKKYTAEEKLVVLVGIVDETTGETVWTECAAEVDAEGNLVVTFDAETLVAMQDGTAILAVVGAAE